MQILWNSEINKTSFDSIRSVKKLKIHQAEFNATLNSKKHILQKLLLYNEALNIFGTYYLAEGLTDLSPFGAGIFFKILAHSVFKMRILQGPKKIAL